MRCHDKEAKEFGKSHHAKAAQFTGALDNFLGNVVEGPEIVTSGCAGCHGSIVKVMEKGKLHPATWPNSGIGRVNPGFPFSSITGIPPPPEQMTIKPALINASTASRSTSAFGSGDGTTRRQPRPASSTTDHPSLSLWPRAVSLSMNDPIGLEGF